MAPIASAQITVLPSSQKTMEECRVLINTFETSPDGKIPTVEQSAAQAGKQAGAAADSANTAYDNAVKALSDATTKKDEIANQKTILAKPPVSADNAMEIVKLGDQYDSAVKAEKEAQAAVIKAADEKSKASAAQTDATNKSLGSQGNQSSERDNLLGCAIKTGRISLAMIPYFITYFANYLLSIVAIICVLFIVLGGYFYIWGGITEKKDKGKAFITHALIGLGIATLAWIIVNSVMAIFTS